MSEPSWNDFQSVTGGGKPAPVDNEFDLLCAQTLTSGSGKQLLAALRKKHFDSPFNPLASERALAIRITNQHFVRELELACERGLKPKPKA